MYNWLVGHDIGQQGQVTRAFDLARKFTLAARTIASLAPRFYLATLANVARNGVQIFVVEAFPFRTIRGLSPTPSAPGSTTKRTTPSRAAPT